MTPALDADRVIKANTRRKEMSGSGHRRVKRKHLESAWRGWASAPRAAVLPEHRLGWGSPQGEVLTDRAEAWFGKPWGTTTGFQVECVAPFWVATWPLTPPLTSHFPHPSPLGMSHACRVCFPCFGKRWKQKHDQLRQSSLLPQTLRKLAHGTRSLPVHYGSQSRMIW